MRAISPATWRRTSSQMSPWRGAAKARSSTAPVSPARITAMTCRCPRRPGAGARGPRAGVSTRPPRSMRSGSSSVSVDLGGVPGPRPRGPVRGLLRPRPASRRPRARRTSCVGTSGASPRGRRSDSVRRNRRWNRTRRHRGRNRAGRSTSTNRACSTRWTTSWAIRSPRAQVDGLARVEVDQQHLDLAAVARVDGAGRVDDRDPEPGRQPGARVHQGDVAVRQRDRDAGRARAPAPPARGARRRW